jgi:luciferase family oxidoreductase group 1
VWLLGSGLESARLAGRRGLPFGFAHHFSPESMGPALDAYRTSFRPSAVLDRPRVLLAVSALCADDDGLARRLALPGALAFLQLRRGRPGPLPSPSEARAYPYTGADRRFVVERFDAQVIGSPQAVRARIEDLLRRCGAGELMVVTGTHDPADRVRSYELLAQALAPAAV